MHPNTQNDRTLSVPNRDTPADAPVRSDTSAAAADVTRSQISGIYDADPNAMMAVETEPSTGGTSAQPGASADTSQSAPTSEPHPSAPTETDEAQSSAQPTDEPVDQYRRTHSDQNLHVDADQWREYHSAWQTYYQQYFHRYYASHAQQAQAHMQHQQKRITELESRVQSSQSSDELTKDQALTDLRSRLRHNVRKQAKTVRSSRHFMPALAALLVMAMFGFMQYNSLLISNVKAYVSPGSLQPANIIVDPSNTVPVSDKPKLIIPKFNIDVPIVWENTMGSTQKETESRQMKAMENGVAWFNIPGANARPGEVGKTVLSGHSSNDFFEAGDYKFIFARLEQIKKDDTIYVNDNGTRYTYTVRDKKVVLPSDLKSLTEPVDTPTLVLITCVPLGTAEKRLLVFADQISPDPQDATKSEDAGSSAKPDATMPGVQPTLLEKLFGA